MVVIRGSFGGSVPLKCFEKTLKKLNPSGRERDWVFIPYDQLTDAIGPLSRMNPGRAGIVMVENRAWFSRRPYHKQKLALLLANMRHFALEQARRGIAVEYIQTDKSIRSALQEFASKHSPIVMMEAAERELRVELAPLIEKGLVETVPHEGWLTTREDFVKGTGENPPWRMDTFYRYIRKQTGYLMKDGGPFGGKFSLDAENREAWKGEPPAPEPPTFSVDDIKREVAELIEGTYSHHPGRLDMAAIAATSEEAAQYWLWAKKECMTHFGPYEDAMSTASRGLFHTRLSPLINIHRLLPIAVLEDTLRLDIPLNSKEGFVRQLIGWREFMKHVHDMTDGFRQLAEIDVPISEEPGDAGYAAWARKPWKRPNHLSDIDGGSDASALDCREPLPPTFWGAPSGMNCLDTVVESVWDEGWSHHITRLMVLSNIATLLDISPRELTDWFWVAYSDAYDWVVEPNVLGMGTFGLGPLFTTKPYVAGSSYINKMSDYCKECRFTPNGNCPIKRLYWAFLARHETKLADNQRMFMIMNTFRKRKPKDRQLDEQTFTTVKAQLDKGKELRPEDVVG